MSKRIFVKPMAAGAAALALAGCASFSPDGGFDAVSRMTNARIGQAPADPREAGPAGSAEGRVAQLLQQPLSADAAVEIALLNNRELRATYAGLGIAEADRVRAGRLPNPSLRFGRLGGNGTLEIDRAVLVDILGLLSLPATRQLEQQRFEQAQLEAAQATVAVAGRARKAYFEAVAAGQLVGYREQVKEAADASAELAGHMREAGNFSALDEMNEQAFVAEAAAGLARARHQAVAAREQLVRTLGLAGPQLAFQLPERLPDLPAAPAAPAGVEQTAVDMRFDVLQARRSAESTAAALGLTKATRFINVLNAGYQNKSATAEPLAEGYEVELELPIFDFGTARVARAEATYMQAVNRAAAAAANAQSEAREAYSAYHTAYEVARQYRDELVPLRKRISEEKLLRYNGMLASVFELLADARDQSAAVVGAIESLRDYWLAETDLHTAMTSGSPT